MITEQSRHTISRPDSGRRVVRTGTHEGAFYHGEREGAIGRMES